MVAGRIRSGRNDHPDFARRRLVGGLVAASALPLLGASSVARASIPSTPSARVVVVGGGFGGATAAKYLRLANPALHVTLVEPLATYHTCPFSNAYLAGLSELSELARGYEVLRDRFAVNVIHTMAEDVDPVAHTVALADGRKLPYDRLVLSPGIEIRWDALDGYDIAASETVPHGWGPALQIQLLRRQLESMPDGGVFAIAAPDFPYRCPPGPYERASLVAHYFSHHKPKSKILILDAKNSFTKKSLFMEGWKRLYGPRIQWIGESDGGRVMRVDAPGRTLELSDGSLVKADVLNVVPPQKAAAICDRAGVTSDGGWAPVKAATFESRLVDDIHVIGDAAIANPMPKSAFSASVQAKVVAAVIAAALDGRNLPEVYWTNTCYSLVAPDYGITIAGVYRVQDGKLVEVRGAGGFSPLNAASEVRRAEAQHAKSWYAAITHDIWGAAA